MASTVDNSTLKPPATKPRRRWYQFTLRTAGVWMALFCLLLGSFAWWRDRAERQRKVVEELRGLGAEVVYRYFSLTSSNPTHTDVYDVAVPEDEFFLCAWLRYLFGEDFVSNVDSLYLAHSEDSPAVPPNATRLAVQFLHNCPHLTHLQLEANAVAGSEFERFPFFNSLEELILVNRSGNTGLLSDDNLAVLQRTSRLRRLELKGQPIGDAAMKHLRNCRRLGVLILDDTMVSDAGLEQFSELTELFWLDLKGTRITDAGLKHLRNLNRLKFLTLSNVAIDGEGLADIGDKVSLEDLDVGETNFADASLRHLHQFPNLRSLNLSWTKITGTGIPHFASFKNLDSMWLGGCPVTDEGIAGIAIPDGIYLVSLSQTKITDKGFCQLKLPQTIDKVDLDSTAVTDRSLDHLHSLANLDVIELKHTKVTSAGVERLRARFPKCTIHDQ